MNWNPVPLGAASVVFPAGLEYCDFGFAGGLACAGDADWIVVLAVKLLFTPY